MTHKGLDSVLGVEGRCLFVDGVHDHHLEAEHVARLRDVPQRVAQELSAQSTAVAVSVDSKSSKANGGNGVPTIAHAERHRGFVEV